MLNQDSLSQLKGLKQQLEAEKERAEAVVKGTQSRYGFAVLDDGREVFIPPDEMLKVFPGDRVRVCIRPTKDNKTIADIEKVLGGRGTAAEFNLLFTIARCVEDPAAVERQVIDDAFVGFKVYHLLADRENTLFAETGEFLPEWAWETCLKRRSSLSITRFPTRRTTASCQRLRR